LALQDVRPSREVLAMLAPPDIYQRNVAQHGDALTLLQALSGNCSPLGIFDPQYRSNLDYLKYGNEGARQKERCALPQMTDEYIDEVCHEFARVLRPGGYLGIWSDTYRVMEGHHKRVKDVLPGVDLIAWFNLCFGQGSRARRCGGYLVMLQKPPLKARSTWRSRPPIRDRWIEAVDDEIHPHLKPLGLIRFLIKAITEPSDLVIDPAAGSFVVMDAAHQLGRDFVGCDLAYAVCAKPNGNGDEHTQ
jgi:site-specific DNA-methyltransferase (adenine-specific)